MTNVKQHGLTAGGLCVLTSICYTSINVLLLLDLETGPQALPSLFLFLFGFLFLSDFQSTKAFSFSTDCH